MRFSLALSFCDPVHYYPLAELADELGWDAVAVADGLFHYRETSIPYPYSEDGSRFWDAATPFMDPLSLICGMAARTRRIHFYPNVLKLAVRHPLLVAKQLATVAVLSGERVGLGVGLSPWPEDFSLLGQDWSNRGPRSAEMIEVIRQALRGEMFEFSGRYYQLPPLQISPTPSRPVPIYIGGLAEPVLRRAARVADGYLGWINPRCTLEDLGGMIRRLHRYRGEYERLDSSFSIKIMPGSGGMEELQRLIALGVDELIVAPWLFYGASGSLEAMADALRRFSAEVLPKLRKQA